LPKPHNIHGAGGGGSSWTGLLKPVASEPITLNLYRDSNWQSNDYGYIVLGLPLTS
jgi:hypothetical protein